MKKYSILPSSADETLLVFAIMPPPVEEPVRWITWKMQPELALEIRYYVDTGSNRDILVQQICEARPQSTSADVRAEIERLLLLGLLVEDHGYIKVTEWAYDTVMTALGVEDWEECLQTLKARGIWHPDMIQYGVATKEEAP